MNNLEKQKKADFLYETMTQELKDLLNDNDVFDIMFNQDGNVFVDKKGVGKVKLGKILSQIKAKQIIELVASYDDKNINRDNPTVDAVLPDGSRFKGLLYECVENNPVFSIRKKPIQIFTLDEYEKNGILTNKHKLYIKEAVKNKKNILIVGGTGTGKTTLTNACLNELKDSKDRIAILEDTKELILDSENVVRLLSTEKVTLRDLLRNAMRLNVDRICVGELRTGDATLELLKAWNSGHEGGISTIHANTAESGLIKLDQYLSEVTQRHQRSVIAETVHVVINIVKTNNNKRLIKEIIELSGYDEESKKYIYKKIERE